METTMGFPATMNMIEQKKETFDLHGWKGVVAYDVDTFDDDNSTIKYVDDTTIMSTVDDSTFDYDDNTDDDDANSSVYNANMFDKIVANGSSCETVVPNNDYDCDSEAIIPEYIFLLFDEDEKQEHIIEFEKSDIDFQLLKNENKNDETCTYDESEYDLSEEGDHHEDDDEDDTIIKIQELSSMTSSIDGDNDDSCISMIDNLLEQFEFDLLELESDISFQFGNTESIISSSTETTSITTTTAISETPTTTIVTEDDIDIDSSSYDYNEFQNHYWPQYNYHPCKRRETIEECDGGALPPMQPMRRNEDKNNTLLPRQHIDIINHKYKVITNGNDNNEQPIKFSRQQYISIG